MLRAHLRASLPARSNSVGATTHGSIAFQTNFGVASVAGDAILGVMLDAGLTLRRDTVRTGALIHVALPASRHGNTLRRVPSLDLCQMETDVARRALDHLS